MYKAQVLAEGGQQAAALALLDAEQVREQSHTQGQVQQLAVAWPDTGTAADSGRS
jgi:hypothetical protein